MSSYNNNSNKPRNMGTSGVNRKLSFVTALLLHSLCLTVCDSGNSRHGSDDPSSPLKDLTGRERTNGSVEPPKIFAQSPTVFADRPWKWDSSKQTMFGTGEFRFKFQDGSWQTTAEKSVTFKPPLPAGTYKIEVQEKGKSGEWSKSAVSEVIVVTASTISASDFYTTAIVSSPTSFKIYESMPPSGANILMSSTISITFDDVIDPATVTDKSIKVMCGGYQYFGTLSGELINLTPTGSIISFAPIAKFPPNADVTVTIGTDLLDNDGGSIAGNATLTFKTLPDEPELISKTTVSFEDSESTLGAPWVAIGNAGVIKTTDQISPTDGSSMIAISSGLSELIGNKPALTGSANGPQISYLALRINIPSGAQKLLFDYDFISAEFDEFVTSIYDDIFTVSITGSEGGNITKTLASVKVVGAAESYQTVFTPANDPAPATPVEHTKFQKPYDTPAGEKCTNCQTPVFNIQTFKGSYLTIIFTVSDVGDAIYDSIGIVDHIRFE